MSIDVNKCFCTKADGSRCQRARSTKAGTNQRYCWQHQKCDKTYTYISPYPSQQEVEKQKTNTLNQSKALLKVINESNPSTKGLESLVMELIKAGADVNYEDKNTFETPLMAAAGKNLMNIVDLLIKNKANVNYINTPGDTALIFAAVENHRDIVNFLIQAGAQIDFYLRGNRTALMWAASFGHNNIIELLLKAKANVNLQNTDGETALSLAKHLGHHDTAKLLIDAGATK